MQDNPRPEVAGPDAPRQSAKGRFARLPQLAGRSFVPLGLFARLPLAMLTVGTLTLVTSVSGSYAVGGTAAGAVGIGSAIGAPVLGALADRRGQRPVLLIAAAFNAFAVLVLIAAAYAMTPAGAFPAALLAAAFASGASCPQVGPLARVRWMALTSQSPQSSAAATNKAANKQDLDTALSYESTADELTFVLGPALVGILASLVAPWLPLALAAALTITLVPAFAVHRTHQAVPIHRRVPARQDGGAKAIPARIPLAVALPVLAMVCMGTFFGATQTALSSFSAGFATSEIAGLLYAVMGVSSAVAALSVAYWPQRLTLSARWLLGAVLMAALAFLLFVPTTATGMVLVLLVLGIPVGPVMVTVFAIGGHIAPAGRLGTVMTALASGIVAGTAAGAAVAGQLAQAHGYSGAFLVPVAAAAALVLLGAASAVVLRRKPA
ncbi:MFS transporter [Arthrobacter sp. S39]|uniref:MFS transporter n=1 Tax=Arthrobacter sp. S39 TaxID=2509720 RepID=UPI001F5F3554|nr:MFS transporter [Arthrobacter sp. S39]